VAAALAGASLPVVVVNPAQVRHFAQALGRRAKTDPIDASMIARFVEATKPDLRELPDEATQLLADLVALRRQIIEMIVAERNREKRVAVMRIRKSIARSGWDLGGDGVSYATARFRATSRTKSFLLTPQS
jgi:transposase